MGSANQQPMLIKDAPAIVVQWTHDLRPRANGQGLAALFKPCARPCEKLILPICIKLPEANPQKCPLGVCVMEEIGIAAIIRASIAGKVQFPSYPVIFVLEPLVDFPQSRAQNIRQFQIFHHFSSEKHCT
jgi:hypothetical protein